MLCLALSCLCYLPCLSCSVLSVLLCLVCLVCLALSCLSCLSCLSLDPRRLSLRDSSSVSLLAPSRGGHERDAEGGARWNGYLGPVARPSVARVDGIGCFSVIRGACSVSTWSLIVRFRVTYILLLIVVLDIVSKHRRRFPLQTLASPPCYFLC